MLSGEIAKRYGAEGLPDDTITLNLTGMEMSVMNASNKFILIIL